MSPSSHVSDRGLRSVRRVRAARELDAQLGLYRAQQEESDLVAAAARREAALAEGGLLPVQLPGAELAARRGDVLRLGDAVREAHERVAAARRVTEAARAHWQLSRTRTRAIDQLLERRAAERRAHAAREEARGYDELATQAWVRRTTEEGR